MELKNLSIKILLSCNKKPLSKKDITQNFKRHSSQCRLESISELLHNELLQEREMPKPNARRVPTYYFITLKGNQWLENYLSDLT